MAVITVDTDAHGAALHDVVEWSGARHVAKRRDPRQQCRHDDHDLRLGCRAPPLDDSRGRFALASCRANLLAN